MKVSEIPSIETMEEVKIFVGGDTFYTRLSQEPYLLSVDIRNTDWVYDPEDMVLRIWI